MTTQVRVDAIASVDFRLGGNLHSVHHAGFSEPEGPGTWSLGTESEVWLPAAGELQQLALRLTVQPCVFPGRDTTQHLTVFAGDILLGSFASRTADWTDLNFSIPPSVAAVNGVLRLKFRHPAPVSPARNGSSSDVRSLAFMFRSLALSGAQKTNAASLPALLAPQDWSNLPSVHRGQDGWLFLIGGSNDVLRYYHDPSHFTDAQAQLWTDLLIRRKLRLTQMGVSYLHIAAPDKISVYPDHFGAPLPYFDRHPTRLLAERLAAGGHDALLIDPLETFSHCPERDLLYLKTDTHWTYRAGQLVLTLVTARLGTPRFPDLEARELHWYEHVWDLGSKVEPPITERYFAVRTQASVSRVHANQLALSFEENVRNGQPVSHGSIYVAFRNTDPSAIDKVLVIFGDSFMDFQDSNTTTIFAETFREVHFVWSPNIDYDFVAKVGAHVVITELAERFMVSLPHDSYTVVT